MVSLPTLPVAKKKICCVRLMTQSTMLTSIKKRDHKRKIYGVRMRSGLSPCVAAVGERMASVCDDINCELHILAGRERHWRRLPSNRRIKPELQPRPRHRPASSRKLRYHQLSEHTHFESHELHMRSFLCHENLSKEKHGGKKNSALLANCESSSRSPE